MSNASVSRAADGAHALIAFASDVLAQIPETPLHGLPAMLAKAIKPVHAATRSINKTTSIALHHSPDGYESVFLHISAIETYATIRRSGTIIAETRTGADAHDESQNKPAESRRSENCVKFRPDLTLLRDVLNRLLHDGWPPEMEHAAGLMLASIATAAKSMTTKLAACPWCRRKLSMRTTADWQRADDHIRLHHNSDAASTEPSVDAWLRGQLDSLGK